MEKQTYTKVVIDGKVYNLAGQKDEAYLQRLASYINHTIAELKEQGGLQKQTTEIRTLQIFLHLADAYLKQKEEADQAMEQLRMLEARTYDLRHRLISEQMQLEQMQHVQEEAECMTGKLVRAEERVTFLQTQNMDLRAQIQLLQENQQALEGKNKELAERYTRLKNQMETRT